MDGQTRRVEVVQSTPEPVPCEVLYFKDSEAPGERQVLWSAGSDAGYCEARAAEFVAQLGGMGWACGTAVRAETPAESATPAAATGAAAAPAPAAPPAPSEPPADDTDALSAPE
jgi:hypothetical protein